MTLIKIFNQVRDIPYRIPLALDETKGGSMAGVVCIKLNY
jgi:hypothetical protein